MTRRRTIALALVGSIGAAPGARAQGELPELPEPAPAPAPSPSPSPLPSPSPSPAPAPVPVPVPVRVPAPAPAPRAFFRLGIQAEVALGVTPGPFDNQVIGARLDRCFTWNTCLGGYLGYANLRGQSGRANDVLAYAMLEHRRPVGSAWFIPIRAATGYLPKNGPFARVSLGVGVRSGNVDFTFELVAPTLWVTGNEPVLSMDLAAEMAVHL